MKRRATWITEDPHPHYSRLDNLDGLRDTFTPSTPGQVTERYRAAVEVMNEPEVFVSEKSQKTFVVLMGIILGSCALVLSVGLVAAILGWRS